MRKLFVLFLSAVMAFAFSGIANAGSLSGKVKGSGGPGAAINVTKDPEVCGAKGDLLDESLVVSGGGVENTVLYIPVEEGEVEPKVVDFHQTNCAFSPHAIIIPSGGQVKLFNDDGILHNFHSLPEENEGINTAHPADQATKLLSADAFDATEVFKVKCDVHDWMAGVFAVMETPFAAVSGKGGAYKISGIDDGEYTLKVWHESKGAKDITVTIAGDTTLDIDL